MTRGAPHLVYFFDPAFEGCTLVSLLTALERTPGPVRVSLHPTGPPDRLESDARTLAEAFGAKIEVRPVDLSAFAHLPRGRLPLAARARLLLPALHDGPVLYLDGDTIVRKDLTPLWQTNIEGACLAACLAPGVTAALAAPARGRAAREAAAKIARRSDRMGGLDMSTYVNSGVMLLDLPRIRAEGLDALMGDIEATARVTSRDQDWINVVFAGRIHLLDPTWNSGWGNPRTDRRALPPELRDRFRESRTDPAICHFTGFEKPWHSPTAPVRLHLLTKPRERRMRAMFWREFRAARERTEASLGHPLDFPPATVSGGE
ncbi:glycosyltransferase [Roseicyclus sp. F158]|uniref:Glycosyltransferase n=1 Tax=Tropicimonas omnivorans TaxID=3075590 RepID=A0ABU3DJW1_9RHOB|nr:glycosyltransferase [Roseicyclus sp. F158]MDT0684004.1 glycosyltransferase [Roseicyclus sp. F158]